MIRLGLLAAAACVLVTACGGPDTSQANNAQANISDSARTETHAAASAVSGSGGQVTIIVAPRIMLLQIFAACPAPGPPA